MRSDFEIIFATGDDFFLTIDKVRYLGNYTEGYFENGTGKFLDFDIKKMDKVTIVGKQKWARYEYLKREDDNFNQEFSDR